MLLWLVACRSPVQPPEPVVIEIAGSTSMQPLLEDLAEAYTRHHKYVTIKVEGGGSRLGMELAREGRVDLAASSQTPHAEGRSIATPLHWSTPIALDGIAIIVHPDNGVEGLTMLQVRDIFSGRILSWKEVGGRAEEIVVVSREEGSGTRKAFEGMVMGGRRVTPTAVVMPGSAAVVEYVAEHPEAIGYVSMGYLTNGLAPLNREATCLTRRCWHRGPSEALRHLSPQVKALAIEGVLPTPESVEGGEYHLIRPLFLVAAEEPTGEVKAFVEFILSPKGQAIVGKGYGRVH